MSEYLAFVIAKNGRSLAEQWAGAQQAYMERFGQAPAVVMKREITAVPDGVKTAVIINKHVPANCWYFEASKDGRDEPQA